MVCSKMAAAAAADGGGGGGGCGGDDRTGRLDYGSGDLGGRMWKENNSE